MNRRGGICHFQGKLVDLLRIFDQLGQRFPIFLKLCGSFLDGLGDFFLSRRNRLQRGLDEFETRHRAGGDRLVGVNDEGVGERHRRLELRGHLFGGERDRGKLRIVIDAARQIVELVAQHIAAAHELILRQELVIVLDLHDIGEDFRKCVEFPVQARDLVDARRIPRVLHRLLDRVSQTGFGRKRRLGIVFLAGRSVISRQRPVRDQFAVDMLGQIGFRLRCFGRPQHRLTRAQIPYRRSPC